MRDREHQHGQREQLARAQPGDLHEDPGDRPATRRRITTATRAASFSSASPRAATEPGAGRRLAAAAASVPEHGDQHQHDDGEDVLDDQPADGDVALRAS